MTVASLISDAKSRTDDFVTDATDALDDVRDLVKAIGYTIPDATTALEGVNLIEALRPPASLSLTLPPFNPVNLEPTTTVPPIGDPAPIQPIAAGVAPTLKDKPDKAEPPTRPAELRTFTESAPPINVTANFPPAPPTLLPPAPETLVRAEPVKPQLSLPVFDRTAPSDLPAAPGDLAGSLGAAYRDAAPSMVAMVGGYVDAQLVKINPRYAEQMGRIETQLTRYLDGGTGLKPGVEDAIYSRAREKNDVEAARVRNAAYGEAASRGFTLPTGALLSAVARARQEAANNNLKAASDIVVMQAEMEQKNLQFAVTTSIGLRKMVLDATLAYMQSLTQLNGQALEYAKSVLGAIIELYNTAVKAFSLKLDGYRAEAAVFETQLKSAMAGIELYKAEIDALQAMTVVDQAKVAVYRARIDALQSATLMYKTQVDAEVSKASFEKLKLDMFQAKVQAYSAEVQAKTAEWNGYSAAWQGEVAKSNNFRAQVDAYRAEVEGYKANIEGQAKIGEGTAMNNKALADGYTARVNAYAAEVRAKGEKARVEVENESQKVHAFQAQAQAELANAQSGVEYFRAVSGVALERAKIRMQAQLGEAASKTAYGNTLAELGASGAKMYGQLAGAALSGINTLASESKSD